MPRRAIPALLTLVLTAAWGLAAPPDKPQPDPAAGANAPPAASPAKALRLVPFPREMKLARGTFNLARPLVLEAPKGQLALLGEQLSAECKLAGLTPPALQALEADAACARLRAAESKPGPLPSAPDSKSSEGYRLLVRPNEAVWSARGPAGLFYGAQTLRQLIRANRTGSGGKAIPCLAVCDWPALRWRCFQDDMTRGPSSKLTTMQRDVRLGETLKMNVFKFYMEYQYAFAKHPKIGPEDGSLTPADLKALVAFAKPRHVDVMGNQQSFGHMSHVLKHPEYADLREASYILAPVNEKTYQLLDDLYSEVIPLLPFEFFNVCCDETWALGKGPSAALAEKIGVGGVYVRHIQRVRKLVTEKYGKRMMMWGDIILKHPDKLDKIPKDVIMLTWGYGAKPTFENQIIPFAKSGYAFFVCPGVSNWSRILPDFGVTVTNVRNFVRDGVKHGAIGMLNTAWEDDGESLNAPKWHGHAWGAECAWTGSATEPADFNRRLGAVLFGEKGNHFGQAIELLAKAHRMPGMHGMNNRRFWQKDFRPKGRSPKAARAQAEALLAVVQPAIEHLRACRKEAVVNAELLDYFLQGAMRMELIGTRMLDGLTAAELYSKACETSGKEATSLVVRTLALVVKNRDATEALGKEFRRLWLQESKPYALDRTMARYAKAIAEYDVLAKALRQAREAAQNGKPLPDPGTLGLGRPKPVVAKAAPARKANTPLLQNVAWAEAKASHRIGLTVAAGKVDRYDLPVEIDVTVPAELSGKRVRAYRLDGSGKPVEIPAQLDALPKGGPRLVVVLPGKLAKGTTAKVHVYLGLAKRPASANAATGTAGTSEAPGGCVWLTNDEVRLLLAPQGAHVFRWEVRGLKGRDLTMPGRRGWAGFSDMARGYRGCDFALAPLARGPAMVRYQCIAPDGMTKTVSLYAGASWLDVRLSTPTGHYWDIDNPKNFAADGPTPGQYAFSDGTTGPVGKQADGVPAQVRADNVYWGIKYNKTGLALGLVTPERPCRFRVAPGAGAGGVGIEASPTTDHFVTFGGILETTPTDTMQRLQQTLGLRCPPEVTLHATQAR